MEELMGIGQFSRQTGLSPRALRLYAQIGLLPPASVDPETGYRSYRKAQVGNAVLIRLLRELGIPLTDIATFLSAPSHAQLDEHWQRVDRRLEQGREVLTLLHQMIDEEKAMSIVVPDGALSRAIRSVASAAATTRERPALQSVHIEAGPDGV